MHVMAHFVLFEKTNKQIIIHNYYLIISCLLYEWQYHSHLFCPFEILDKNIIKIL